MSASSTPSFGQERKRHSLSYYEQSSKSNENDSFTRSKSSKSLSDDRSRNKCYDDSDSNDSSEYGTDKKRFKEKEYGKRHSSRRDSDESSRDSSSSRSRRFEEDTSNEYGSSKLKKSEKSGEYGSNMQVGSSYKVNEYSSNSKQLPDDNESECGPRRGFGYTYETTGGFKTTEESDKKPFSGFGNSSQQIKPVSFVSSGSSLNAVNFNSNILPPSMPAFNSSLNNIGMPIKTELGQSVDHFSHCNSSVNLEQKVTVKQEFQPNLANEYGHSAEKNITPATDVHEQPKVKKRRSRWGQSDDADQDQINASIPAVSQLPPPGIAVIPQLGAQLPPPGIAVMPQLGINSVQPPVPGMT